MALTVEDGSGVTGADSYLSTADIGTYGTNHGLTLTAWNAATQAQQDAWARKNARVLDALARRRYPGAKRLSTQGLQWPRVGAYDAEQFSIASDVVPQQIKDAQSHLTILESNGTDTAADAESGAPVEELEAASGARIRFGRPLSIVQQREVWMILEPLIAAEDRYSMAPKVAVWPR